MSLTDISQLELFCIVDIVVWVLLFVLICKIVHDAEILANQSIETEYLRDFNFNAFLHLLRWWDFVVCSSFSSKIAVRVPFSWVYLKIAFSSSLMRVSYDFLETKKIEICRARWDGEGSCSCTVMNSNEFRAVFILKIHQARKSLLFCSCPVLNPARLASPSLARMYMKKSSWFFGCVFSS